MKRAPQVSQWRGTLLTGCMLLAALSGFMAAQTTGSIRGTVKDPSGAVVPGARLSVVHQGTQAARSITANASGDFEAPALPVGLYTLRAEVPGFKKYEQTNIEVTLGHVVVANVQLQVGASTEVVNVSSEATLIETTNTQLGAVVADRTVTGLPLNQRDTYQFLQLQPGVQSQLGSDLFLGSNQTGVVSVNGGRGRSNNYMVNGGDGNDLSINLPAIQPSPDTIQEFRVLTNTFDAEYGRNSGAVVNVVTKAGTNRFHGSTYEFFRNRVLNSRGFFDTAKPDFKMNQFGGTLGGPIRKDHTFFFASYEGRRIRQGIPSDTVTVPSLQERNGDFSGGPPFAGTLTDANLATALNNRPGCVAAVAAKGGAPIAPGTPYASIFPNNQIPVACFDPTANDLMQQFVPLPNLGNSLFQATPDSKTRQDQFTARIDQTLTPQQQLNIFYYFSDQNFFEPFNRRSQSGANLPGFGDINLFRFQQWNVSHTWVVNPHTINEFRVVYFREAQGQQQHPQRANLVQDSCANVPSSQCFSSPSNPKLGITPGLGANREGVPFINVAGGFSIGNNFVGEEPQIGNSFQFVDNFTKTIGNHSAKFGGDVRRQRFDQLLAFDVNGAYQIFGAGPNAVGAADLFPNYLLGIPDIFFQGSAQTEAVRFSSLYLYGQDSWKIKPNLTLNYGLRWELNTPLGDVSKHINTFRQGQATSVYPCQLAASNPLLPAFGTTNCNPGSPGQAVFPLGLVVPGDKGISPALTGTYYRSFAPRVGLAWSPNSDKGWVSKLTGGPGKASVRAAWGMFYNPVEQLALALSQGEPPFGGSTLLANPMFNTPFLGQNGSVSPNPFNGILTPPPGQAIDWAGFRPIVLFGQLPPLLRSQYSEQYNLTVQRELAKDVVFQIGYVGTQGHRLLGDHDLNPGTAQTCLDLNQIPGMSCGPFQADGTFIIPANAIPPGVTVRLPYGSTSQVTGPNPNPITLVGLRPLSSPYCQPTSATGAGCPPDGIPVFGSIFSVDNIAFSNYNSLQAMLEKRFSHGLQLQAAYTWSKSFDNSSSLEEVINPFNPALSRSLSLFDARQRLTFTYNWALPIPAHTGAVGKVINGWEVSGVTAFQSGFPILITSASDIELQNDFNGFMTPGEPDQVAPFRTMDPRKNPQQLYFDPAAFANPALGQIGNSRRTVCCGPGINNFDMAFLKNTPVGERTTLQFRAAFFNIFNHTQFFNPDGNFSDGSNFGTVRRARDPRLVQFALKLLF